MIPSQKKIAECYQPLFDLLNKEHGLILLQSEMDEIIRVVVDDVNDALTEIWKSVCDVKGCDEEPVNGGGCWKDGGYWSVCSKHSQDFRDGKPQPEMKEDAIEKEKSRDERGYLPVNPSKGKK